MATLKNLPASVMAHRAGSGRNIATVPPVVYTSTMLVSNVCFLRFFLAFVLLPAPGLSHLVPHVPPLAAPLLLLFSITEPWLEFGSRGRGQNSSFSLSSLSPSHGLPYLREALGVWLPSPRGAMCLGEDERTVIIILFITSPWERGRPVVYAWKAAAPAAGLREGGKNDE